MYPRRVFNVFISSFFALTGKADDSNGPSSTPSLVQLRVAVHPCCLAFKCNTHEHLKTIQVFSAPQNSIRKSEPIGEHKKRSASNANQGSLATQTIPKLSFNRRGAWRVLAGGRPI